MSDPVGGAFAIIPVEDLIADRMGQYGSGSAPEMLEQARTLSGRTDKEQNLLNRI